MDHFRDLETSWKESKLCKKLVEYLKNDACNMRPVNRVVCLDLHRLREDRFFREHLVAVTIRDTLQNSETMPMQIIAQSSEYCTNCAKVLKDMFGITMVERPDAFLHVDQNTFVIAYGWPDARTCQWTLDKTRKVGGPAALLCDPVEQDDRHANPADFSWYSSPELLRWTKECEEADRALVLNEGFIPDEEKEEMKWIFGLPLGKRLYWGERVEGLSKA